MKSTYDLSTVDGVRHACGTLNPADHAQWLRELAETFEWVRQADLEQRAKPEFQRRLWEENNISAIGQGRVSVDEAIDDEAFRRWLAERSLEPLPADWKQRAQFLTRLYEDIIDRLRPLLTRDTKPRLKIFRVMAALYPEAMTTIASVEALSKLARAMKVSGDAAPAVHVAVRQRFDDALGPVGNGVSDLAGRISRPWEVYRRFVADENGEADAVEVTPAAVPVAKASGPLPAAMRRRGMTGTKGYFEGLLSTLEFLSEKGATRSELLEYLHLEAPDAKASSRGVIINAYEAELGAIRKERARYVLTEAGQLTLTSQDPTPLSEWILHKVLGADLTLAELRDRGPLSPASLTAVIRKANPGWSTDYVPRAIILWFRSMGAVDFGGGQLSLTARGRDWARRITWTPELLQAPDPPDVASSGTLEVPQLARIIESVQAEGQFDAALIAKLHAGLWSHPRRHFGILTGLSGAGKTLLARSYAKALTLGESAARLLTIPVQPGWHDPGALTGYINPLAKASYVRTEFVDFVLSAVADPTRPYVVVLDEMNLSHPEQYMAPFLSAMETGDVVRFHAGDDEIDGVPPAIPYPTNLAFIGTINMDETTHGLSDKVLDRGFVLEFWSVDLDAYPKWGTGSLSPELERRARELLVGLMGALQPARLHFGWRVVDDVLAFLSHAERSGLLASAEALDAATYAKVLPKLRGEDSPRFRAALSGCEQVLGEFGLAESRRKVSDLLVDLAAMGSARFWR